MDISTGPGIGGNVAAMELLAAMLRQLAVTQLA
jgi:hypothetical protein